MTEHRDNFGENNQHRSSTVYIILILCCLLLAGIGFVCFRLRGGVQVKAQRDGDILSDAETVLYRQDDERWGDDRLGDSKYTMGSSGCLVSCIASALSMEGGIEETPGSLNEKLSEMQAYDTEGNLQWQPLSEGGEYHADVYGEVSADIIDTCLLQGHYPIARVRMYALGNVHYVLIVGAKDGEYLCMDPLRDEITELSDYGSRVYAVRCVYYGDLSPRKEEDTENAESMDYMRGTGNSENKRIFAAENLPDTDLNRNGIPEELRVVETEDGEGEQLEVWENGERLLSRTASYAHVDQKAIFLCRLDGADYLLQYYPTMYQGYCDYSYTLITMEDGCEKDVQWNEVSFDINFGSPVHGEFDPEAVAAFMEEVNGLLSDSIQLINTDGNLQQTFETEGRLADTLWWLDSEESGFHRDSGKSLLENLQDFQEAMTPEEENISVQSFDTLPFTQEMEMTFCSGAGAWRTSLRLSPDGSFTGYYIDSDMGATGEDYPNGTRYVCDFHGRFGEIEQISDASFSLTLEELATDTGRPVGEEWIEDGVRCISSEPYGFDGEDGRALAPGASFLFYTPEATGDKLGTELYGAVEFWRWWPHRREFLSENDTLDCYGLHNLETGEGFFSEEIPE